MSGTTIDEFTITFNVRLVNHMENYRYEVNAVAVPDTPKRTSLASGTFKGYWFDAHTLEEEVAEAAPETQLQFALEASVKDLVKKMAERGTIGWPAIAKRDKFMALCMDMVRPRK